MIGHITNVRDFGTIVQVTVEMGHDMQIVNFDHRMFSHVVDAKTSGDPFELIGRDVEITGSYSAGSKGIRFLDEVAP